MFLAITKKFRGNNLLNPPSRYHLQMERVQARVLAEPQQIQVWRLLQRFPYRRGMRYPNEQHELLQGHAQTDLAQRSPSEGLTKPFNTKYKRTYIWH